MFVQKEKKFKEYIEAGSAKTTAKRLRQLASNADEKIRRRVAENENCTPEVLTYLSQDAASEVRLAVGINPCSPHFIVAYLACDNDTTVKFGLAENHRLDQSLLEKLTLDDNPYVCARANQTIARLNKDMKCHHFEVVRCSDLVKWSVASPFAMA